MGEWIHSPIAQEGMYKLYWKGRGGRLGGGEGVNLSCNSTAQRLKGTLTKYIDMLHVFLNFCYVHLSKLLGVYFIEEVNLSCNCTAQRREGF